MEGIGCGSVRDCLGLCAERLWKTWNTLVKVEGSGRDLNHRPPEYEAGHHPLDGDVRWQSIQYKVYSNKLGRDS
jgi:hypothetical protein